MKIFERDGKINFVDDNNVFVGFDYSQSCCESFGYFLHQDKRTVIASAAPDPGEHELAGYQFDTSFKEDRVDMASEVYDGGAVMFRLTKADAAELYLTLYNCHNGYYGHGFTMDVGGQQIHSGCL